MSFCAMLRRRPSCSTLIPILTAPGKDGMNLRETSLQTHDIAIQLPASSISSNPPLKRVLRLLILTPSYTTAANMPPTLSRIQHFVSLTGGIDIAIIFLLAPSTSNFSLASAPALDATPLHAYASLQAELVASAAIPPVPVLPLTTPALLPNALKKYIVALFTPHPPGQKNPNAALDLLPFASTDAPPAMGNGVVVGLTDVFESLRDVAVAAITGDQEAARRLFDAVGKDVASGVIEFWKEEWVAE